MITVDTLHIIVRTQDCGEGVDDRFRATATTDPLVETTRGEDDRDPRIAQIKALEDMFHMLRHRMLLGRLMLNPCCIDIREAV